MKKPMVEELTPSTVAANLSEVDIVETMKNSYLDYAMSVNIARALPSALDGLKPVARRILYTMYDLDNVASKPFKKSSKISGQVGGNLHPHADCYQSIVHLAQDWTLRYKLVMGQGNFGDGFDPAAASRYTEVRLEKITDLMLNDLGKNTLAK